MYNFATLTTHSGKIENMLLLARLLLFETFACTVLFISCRRVESVNHGIPQPPIENVQIQVGMVVKRGRDWQYGDQDGMKPDGKPALGVVVEVRKWKKSPVADIVHGNKVDETAPEDIVRAAKEGKYKPLAPLEIEGSVRVYWRGGSGNVNVYRYGADGKYDIDIYDTSIVDIDWDYVFKKTKQKSAEISVETAEKYKKIAEADYAALKKIGQYLGVNDRPGWRHARGWLEGDQNPCVGKWTGISCDDKGRVYAIDLSSNGLMGIIPKDIGELTALRTLTLSGNKIGGSLPLELGNLTSLEWLSVHDNLIEGSIPGELGNCLELKWLSFYNNRFSGPVPIDLAKLKKLEYLLVQQNELTGRVPEALLNFPNLKKSQWHNNLFGKKSKRV